MAEVNRNLDRELSRLPGVTAQVRATAGRIATTAEQVLAGHRTGEVDGARIEVRHERVDSLVVLEDPASLSIEFGRSEFTTGAGRTVGAMEGLHILGRAVAANRRR